VTATAATRPNSVRGEAAEVMRCLRESLRQPAFTRVLARLVTGNGRDEERKDTRDFASDAFPENGKGLRVLETPAAPYSAIVWLQRPSYAQC
jgi:hypothetical protein